MKSVCSGADAKTAVYAESVGALPIRGLRTQAHHVQVPLDHSQPASGTIRVFLREVADPTAPDRPALLFLQGGPGFESPRPTLKNPAWLPSALKYFRVFFLDQRGTGLSDPITRRDARDPDDLANRLVHYRADAIVDDAEYIRGVLGIERWSLLGQSFGGFVALNYLSRYPESLQEVLFAGGLPPVGHTVDEIYGLTHQVMRHKSRVFFNRFPDSVDRFQRALAACRTGKVLLPNGELLSPNRLRSIGHLLGTSSGEQIHYLLEHDPHSPAFSHDVASMLPFRGRNPLYAVLHEACYADGGQTNWSAARTLPTQPEPGSPVLTGEHLFPWHFQEDHGLIPFREVAELVAAIDWPRLYDVQALRTTTVPCAAAIYGDDPFVLRQYSEETAALIPGMRTWGTNEYEHSGLRTSGTRVFDRLLALARDLTD